MPLAWKQNQYISEADDFFIYRHVLTDIIFDWLYILIHLPGGSNYMTNFIPHMKIRFAHNMMSYCRAKIKRFFFILIAEKIQSIFEVLNWENGFMYAKRIYQYLLYLSFDLILYVCTVCIPNTSLSALNAHLSV